MVVLGALRGRNPIHMFASASRLQHSKLRRGRSRSGAIIRTRTRNFLERREGNHVCEAVQCRSLGLSLSNGRGLELTHTFDRSHRRTCRHQDQECKRITIVIYVSIFHVFLGYYYILRTRSNLPRTRTLFWRERTPYSTIPRVSRIVVMSYRPLYQTNHTCNICFSSAQDPKTRRVWTTKSHQ